MDGAPPSRLGTAYGGNMIVVVIRLVDSYRYLRCGCFLHVLAEWVNLGGRGATAMVWPCGVHATAGMHIAEEVHCFPGGVYARELYPGDYKPAWAQE